LITVRTSILLAVLLLLPGCSYVKGAFEPVAGRDFAAESLGKVVKGTASADVVRLLGEPLERVPEGGRERWRYYVLEERVDETRLFGAAVSKQRWKRETEAHLILSDGRVSEISYNSRVVPPS
jgi:outer membrane protein assembly factor BamE (lipoprotein component of BamABCDE complex)